MSHRASRRAAPGIALFLTVALVPLGLVPPAAAHCPAGTAGNLLGVTNTCQFNDELEVAIDQANAAADGQVAFVMVKDLRFHPDVVTIKTGGTVVFVYADVDQSQQHDPKSSGLCATGSAVPNPETCVPVRDQTGRCFWVFNDDGATMSYAGQTYPITLKYAAGSGLIQKSRGFLTGTPVGDLTGAQPFRNCPAGTGYNSASETIIAYHCGVHGAADTQIKDMRGAIVVEAA